MRSVASEPNPARWVDSRQSLGSCHFPSYVLKQGAFAPPALPGFVTTTPPSAIHGADSIPHGIVVAGLPAPHRHGLPLLHGRSLPCVLPPLPRWNRRMHFTLASPTTSAFLVIMASRLPRLTFRGLLSVHSRCGPQGPLTSFEAISRSASAHLLPPGPPPVLPAGARVGRVGLAPTNQPCLCKAHTITGSRTRSGRLPLGAIMFSPRLCGVAGGVA